MEVKKLGSTQVQLPEVGLGTWQYAGGVGPLRAGIEQGACFIDTAEIYGTEDVVGEALLGLRNRIFVATKVAPRNFRRLDLIAAAESSLRRLRTEYIDLYQLHWPNYTVPIDETMGAMEELVEAGKVRFIGVSNFSVHELRKAQAALSKWRIVSNQIRYSLMDRTAEANGILQFCRESKITVIAYSPFGTTFSKLQASDPEGILAQAAREASKTEAQVAINWLIAKENVVTIPKASTVPHVIENCAASGWRLAPETYGLLEAGIRSRQQSGVAARLRRFKRQIAQRVGRQL
jgi:diketogulonate reductase-like aldo/keto reductase